MRSAWNIGIILSILFLPWWIGAIAMTVACFMIPRFYEVVFYGILIDALYGTRFGLYGFAYVFSVFSVIIFFLTAIIRKRVLW